MLTGSFTKSVYRYGGGFAMFAKLCIRSLIFLGRLPWFLVFIAGLQPSYFIVIVGCLLIL
jgi:hypothetical protein